MLPKLVNLALIGLFPIAWAAPLVSTEVAWLFTVEEISIFSGVRQLYDIDPVLSVIVGFFAVVAPYLKTLALVYAQFSPREDARRILPLLEFLGRLSMVDVFLIALSVLVYRGVGAVQVQWGFYLFGALVLASIWSSWATARRRFRRVLIEDAEAIAALRRSGNDARWSDDDARRSGPNRSEPPRSDQNRGDQNRGEATATALPAPDDPGTTLRYAPGNEG